MSQECLPEKVVLYTRVSSKEQEQEGFSIPAQDRYLREYAGRRGLTIVGHFQDIETAKREGRPGFLAMLKFLKGQELKCGILVEKTDRLARNMHDYLRLEDGQLTVYLAKENDTIAPNTRSSQNLMNRIRVVLAQQYVDNLSEETMKGMNEKAAAGIWPSNAPIGYRNVAGPDGRRTIEPDLVNSKMIAKLFEEFANGSYSLKSLSSKAAQQGWMLNGKAPGPSVIHQILRRRLYSGEFDWNGKRYSGQHTPLITAEVWKRAQDLLSGRKSSKSRKQTQEFLYRGLIHCGHCGCLCVGEIKKGKYVYYHCTGNRGRCGDKYTKEETLHAAILKAIADLVVPREIFDWLDAEIVQKQQSEAQADDLRNRRLNQEIEKVKRMRDVLYNDRLDGRIGVELYDSKAGELQTRLADLESEFVASRRSLPSMSSGLKAMEMFVEACRLFPIQPLHEKRKLLMIMLDSSTLKQGKFEPTLKMPFESLRRSNSQSALQMNGLTVGNGKIKEWLPDMDSNHD